MMKTEQAIRKLGQLLCGILGREYIDKYCEDKNGNLVSVSSISVDGIAEELLHKGYGDVSEYKAEIERLKAENERFESNMKAVLEIEKKQAQIDVLNKFANKLKRDMICTAEYDDGTRLLQTSNKLIDQSVKIFVDELIKEVQNAEDKG